METTFPGIKVFVSCLPEYLYLLKDTPRNISKNELLTNKKNYAYIRELSSNMITHPVEDFMKESDMPCGPIANLPSPLEIKPQTCALLTNSTTTSQSLNGNQIQKACEIIKGMGCEPIVNEYSMTCDWIMGVENEFLFEAASKGKATTLISTGLGENLFQSMFPGGQIIKL